jgi:exoribonuclease-2
MVRADTLPLVLPVMGGQNLPRGARVRVKLGEIDLITLDITGTVIERLDTPVAEQGVSDNADEEDDEVSGPIAIAVDVSEPAALANDIPVP